MADDKDAKQQAPDTGDEAPIADFDAWLAEQPQRVRDAHAKHTAGLTSALDKEREKAKDAAKELRALAKDADEKTAARLNDLATEKDAEVENARAELAFTREAIAAGCKPELLADAWLIAKAAGLTDVKALKGEKPWLFVEQRKPDAKPGAGSNGKPAVTPDMDGFIRAKAHA